jgi:hypothetical protein
MISFPGVKEYLRDADSTAEAAMFKHVPRSLLKPQQPLIKKRDFTLPPIDHRVSFRLKFHAGKIIGLFFPGQHPAATFCVCDHSPSSF